MAWAASCFLKIIAPDVIYSKSPNHYQIQYQRGYILYIYDWFINWLSIISLSAIYYLLAKNLSIEYIYELIFLIKFRTVLLLPGNVLIPLCISL